MTDYLTIADVLAIHEDLIATFGGAEGVRDLGLLDAALFRPQTGYYPDLIAEAAALWESLSDDEREGELALSPEQRAELDRRWADHEKRPDNAIPWSDVRRKLLQGE